MNSRVIEFSVGNGQTILVEVDDLQLGNRAVSRGSVEKVRDSFETAVAQVKPAAEALLTQLQDLTSKPEQVTLEFGIKFTAGADALIAKTSLEGNVKVTLAWKAG
jgi:hypothetical protein